MRVQREVRIPSGQALLEGALTVPYSTRGVVLFAHGSGSSRHSPRNRFVAALLQEAGFATLLFDLLTPDEEPGYDYRFDIDLLATRLVKATTWVHRDRDAGRLPVGYFGASTGAAAALTSAAFAGSIIRAVVSRGGRPELAAPYLSRVTSPTLLIVGGEDTQVLALNRRAYQEISGVKRLEIVPGATHLFEEPGALETVARLARDWFMEYLRR